jgi:hypothetical protein
MPNDSALMGIVFLLLLLLVVAQWLLHYRQERLRRELFAQQKREIEILKQTVGALCSSAVGVDKRVNRLERQGRDLEERQESIEQSSQYGEPPYADAIRMVQEGAGPDELVRDLGISRDAADLIIMMHGIKHDAIN